MEMEGTEKVEPVPEPDMKGKELIAIEFKEKDDEQVDCQICLITMSKNATCRNICSDICSAVVCMICLEEYLEFVTNSTIRGLLTRFKCPICIGPMNAYRLVQYELYNEIESVRRELEASCEILCPECHDTCNMLPDAPHPQDSLEAMKYYDEENWPQRLKKLSLLKNVGNLCLQYVRHELTPQNFMLNLKNINLDSGFYEYAREVLCHIYDPERRAALFLAMMQYNSFDSTPCCSREICFNCKRDGHHEDEPCETYLSSVQDIAQCPDCEVFLVRGDGCSSISCFCGANFDWDIQVKEHRMRALTELAFSNHRTAFQKILAYLRFKVQRTRYSAMVISQISSFVLQQKITNLTPVLFYPPWSTTFREKLNVCMTRRRLIKVTIANRGLYSSVVITQVETAVQVRRIERISRTITLAPWSTTFKALVQFKIARKRYSAIVGQIPSVHSSRIQTKQCKLFSKIMKEILQHASKNREESIESMLQCAPWSTTIKARFQQWINTRRERISALEREMSARRLRFSSTLQCIVQLLNQRNMVSDTTQSRQQCDPVQQPNGITDEIQIQPNDQVRGMFNTVMKGINNQALRTYIDSRCSPEVEAFDVNPEENAAQRRDLLLAVIESKHQQILTDRTASMTPPNDSNPSELGIFSNFLQSITNAPLQA